jgi:hypothetical protein
MDIAGDRRAQSVQVGVIILFGFLVLAYSGYQANVVPDQNREIEFEHNQDVQADMTDLRSAILRSASERGTRSVSVQLGTNYPSRSIFVNPASPSGRLQTVGTSDASVAIEVDNADATDDEAGDFWDGTTTRSYSTGGIAYTPLYNYYREAPTTVYDTTVLANQFDGAERPTSGQAVVDGRRITLVTLDGELSENGVGSTSVDVSGVSASDARVTVSDDGGPVTVSLPTTLSESTWEDELLADQIDDDNSGPTDGDGQYVGSFDYDESGDPAVVTLEFETGVDYELSLARVGVGSGATVPDQAYAVDVEGDETSIPAGASQQLVVEVRDAFNNPVSGVGVCAETDGTFASDTVSGDGQTNEDGQATFTYDAPNTVSSTDTAEVTVAYTCSGGTPSPGSNVEAATFDVQVYQTGGGAGFPRVAYQESGTLRGIDASGATVDYPPGSATAMAQPNLDADGDGDRDLPFVDGSDSLVITDTNDNTQTTVDSSGDLDGTRMGIGDWNDDGTTEIVYVRDGVLYSVIPGSSPTRLCASNFSVGGNCLSNTNYPAQAVAGVADFDGDGNQDVVYVDGWNEVVYLDQETDAADSTGASASTANAVSRPADYDGNPGPEIAFTDGSSLILIDDGGVTATNTTSYSIAQTPMAALDLNGDGASEVIHINADTGELYYYDVINNDADAVTDDNGDTITPATAPGAT